jgi:hypothetical protein
MPLTLALFLVVHGCIHIGYICGPAWPFVATDPWLVSALGASPDVVHSVGVALVIVTSVAYLLAALTVVGLLPRIAWKPFVVVAAMASAIVLTLFITPWTLPGLAIDAVLLWATLVAGWHPTPFFGSAGRSASGSREALR